MYLYGTVGGFLVGVFFRFLFFALEAESRLGPFPKNKSALSMGFFIVRRKTRINSRRIFFFFLYDFIK